MAVDEAVLGLEVQVRNVVRVEEFQRQDNGSGVELRLRAVQQPQDVQDVEKLAARHELHQEVDRLRTGEGTHELHQERVIHLEQDAPLVDDCLLLTLLDDRPLPHALNGIAHARLGVLHHLHDAEPAAADDPDELQVAQLDPRVLQPYPLLKIGEARALNDLPEGLLAHHPQLRAVLDGDDVGSPRLVEEQRALPKVVASAKRPDHLALDDHLHGALVDDVEVRAHAPLLHDDVAAVRMLDLHAPGQALQLLCGKVPEEHHRPEHSNLVGVVQGEL
mmetsp:Transcript_92014/g.265497  ORF Transcript_92014/g.265497 Transcript_92014/m.265497 type:complete len:276 (-) Transcript_92014:2054-2881(-)